MSTTGKIDIKTTYWLININLKIERTLATPSVEAQNGVIEKIPMKKGSHLTTDKMTVDVRYAR